jgi:serine/threonine protein kinase
MNCPNCNAQIQGEAAFCPSCGSRTDPPPGDRFAGATYSGLETIAPMRETRASTLEPGTRFANRYEVIRMLGEGGMGIVYVARDTNTGEEMVLKLIHPDLVAGERAVKRLMAEGLTARQIRHPNIVAVYDVSLHDGQPYFTMEYVRGGTLRSWLVNGISAGREVPLRTAAGLIKTMLAGLAEAHRMGVVHRDLKPENVLLCGNPDEGNFDLKILDFGIAKAVGATPSQRTGGPIGTPIYMAPEQMTSAEAVGPPADMYSLSVMLYELLMDAPPQARLEPVSKHRRDVPKSVDDLLEKGLSARPRSRYSSAAEFAAALDTAVAGVAPQPDVLPDPEPPPPPPPPPPDKEIKPLSLKKEKSAGKSRTTKVLAWGTAVFVGLAVIGSLMEPDIDPPFPPPDDNTFPDQPEVFYPPDDVKPPPEDTYVEPAPAFNAAGFWIDGYNNRFEVTHDGYQFVAAGVVPVYGYVQFSGTLTEAGASFTVSSQAGVYSGTGTIWYDNEGYAHLRWTLQDGYGTQGDFHINHYAG